MRLCIEVSPGEAIDKLTILSIKEERLTDAGKLSHIRREAELLRGVVAPLLNDKPALRDAMDELAALNRRLWDLENGLRAHERRGEFEHDFLCMARTVCLINDRRAAVKADINTLLGTDIAEQKSYAD